MDIFNLYKPLRNYTRQFSVIDSLSIIRAYCQHLQFNQPLPGDIKVSPQFSNAKTTQEKGVFEWELDILAREIIINSAQTNQAPKSLKE